jgi:uncharacterized repeat protein (TIGR03803 family)
MDSQGNLYGTTTGGGAYTNGTVFELANSSGSFVYRILYSFGAVANDGAIPFSSLVMDSTGNIFGTTSNGGLDGIGTVFELVSSSGFAERVLHNFGVGGGPRDGYFPYAALTFDSAGNLYGTTANGGLYSFGTVFELAPTSGSNSYQILHNFNPASGEGSYPYSTLIIDAAGNLYGTTVNSQGALVQATDKMGANRNESVVARDFHVWGTKELYVVDGSVFPTSVGANPMQSIYTFAKIFADRLADQHFD